MKKIMLLVLGMLIVCVGYCHPNLGGDRSVVITDIKELGYKNVTEGLTSKGIPYIAATDPAGDLMQWFFDAGKVFMYVITMDGDDLNATINYLNRNFVHDETWQWSDYTTGTRVYIHIQARDQFYDLIETERDLTN